MANLIPDLMCKRLFDIDLSLLQDQGIRGILVDLDNTLTRWQDREIDPETAAWVEAALAKEMRLCIVSNSNGTRAEEVAGKLGIASIKNAAKPTPSGINRAMQLLGLRPEETAMVGDQLYTDVLGGKRAGIFTVLLEPIHKREFVYTRCVRIFERRKLKALGLRG
jgi:HAD superfamily phosphatase (TIGR01668 family)